MEQFIIFSKDLSNEELKKFNITISNDSTVEDGAKIFSKCCIMSHSVVYSSAEIHSNSIICDTVIANNVKIFSSRIYDSEIEDESQVGPFAVVKNSHIGKNCRIGNFSELEQVKLGRDVKIQSLCSIKNCEIGMKTTLSSGVIFANSCDSKVIIGERVNIGSNTTIIAPVCIADECLIDVSSTISKDVDFGKFSTSRQKQIIK